MKWLLNDKPHIVLEGFVKRPYCKDFKPHVSGWRTRVEIGCVAVRVLWEFSSRWMRTPVGGPERAVQLGCQNAWYGIHKMFHHATIAPEGKSKSRTGNWFRGSSVEQMWALQVDGYWKNRSFKPGNHFNRPFCHPICFAQHTSCDGKLKWTFWIDWVKRRFCGSSGT